MRRGALLGLLALSCGKVPIVDVGAAFTLADVAWFAQEETLFVFYEVHAAQGLGEPSVVEITWVTDTERVPWTAVTDMPTVHTHLPVDCGTQTLCGSSSLHVRDKPRDVALRMRYHREGELALDANTVFNTVDGPQPHRHRSLLVYGVFDEANQLIQWRSRHQFPTLRNESAQALGLRRDFVIRDQAWGQGAPAPAGNPYSYGVPCPPAFVPADMPDVRTNARAAFNSRLLPVEASAAALVCASSTVTDATGTFTTGAVARKNPEVYPAFPILRSPIREATPVPFFLAPCDRVISSDHEEMQRQRLLVGNLPTTCIDDWDAPGFADGLVAAMTDAIEAERPAGRDMVLVVGLHQDEAGVAEVVEEALAEIVPEERHRTSPRLAGAFVLDSDIRGLETPALRPVTLWCPSTLVLDQLPDASSRTCAIAPDNPDFELGPFTFGTLPILPSRTQYLDFIDTYSKRQAGEVDALSFRAPEFAATSDHVDLGDFGVVTFLNNEIISADADDAFSHCIQENAPIVAVRSDLVQSEEIGSLSLEDCLDAGLPPDICAVAALGLLPVEYLPLWHDLFREQTYEIGVFWEFPFLLHMDYVVVAAGAVGAFGLSVPFGIAQNSESYLGTDLWNRDAFVLEERLLQCERFCDHPTFDSAGVYHINAPFRTTYASSCYLPSYPELGDSGFPLDP